MPLSPIREISALDLQPLANRVRETTDVQFPRLQNGLDLNFAGEETQHSTHSLHPYVAAINPPLAATLIRHYVPQGEILLDPFCGGGGVLVECLHGGRPSIGYDVNPLAVAISRAKTTRLPRSQTFTRLNALIQHAREIVAQTDVDAVPKIIRFWYLESSLAPLCALRTSISEIAEPKERHFFLAILSATARDVMLTYRGEIRLRRLRDRDLQRFNPDVFSAFIKRATSSIPKVSELPEEPSVTVEQKDCRMIGTEAKCHTVITSPPYGDDKNGVGYFQFSRNMLFWMGYSLEEIQSAKRQFLGERKESESARKTTSPTLDVILTTIGGRSALHHLEALQFYEDYFEGLRAITKVTDTRVIVIIGDRVLARTKIDNGHITTELMEDLGFHLEHYYDRELRKKRIANLGGDGGGIAREHILVYRR